MNAVSGADPNPGAFSQAKNLFQGTKEMAENKITDFLKWPDRQRTPEGRRVARIIQAVGIIFVASVFMGFSIWTAGGMTAFVTPFASFTSFTAFMALPMPVLLSGYGFSQLFNGVFDSDRHPKARRIAMCVVAVSVPILCFATGGIFLVATSVAAGFTVHSFSLWAIIGALTLPTGFFAASNAINVWNQQSFYKDFGNGYRREDMKHLQQEIEMQEIQNEIVA
ncbi:MAG: hypothetical protein S4CHLAM123_03780 [Chlamydiales bacterium]|nr:hypothetical protein [Chlamydiales bacterium]